MKNTTNKHREETRRISDKVRLLPKHKVQIDFDYNGKASLSAFRVRGGEADLSTGKSFKIGIKLAEVLISSGISYGG